MLGGRVRASSLLARLHVSSQLRSSFLFQCPCTVKEPRGPPDQFVKAYLAQTPPIWTVGIASFCSTPLSLSQCNLLPPEIGSRTEKKDTRQHQHSNKYCSSQIGITFCFGCIELDLAR